MSFYEYSEQAIALCNVDNSRKLAKGQVMEMVGELRNSVRQLVDDINTEDLDAMTDTLCELESTVQAMKWIVIATAEQYDSTAPLDEIESDDNETPTE